MPVLRVALAALVVALAFQASAETGASGWVPMDDVGCELILGFGHDEASNLIDRCPLSGTQEGDNNSDFVLVDDAHGNFDSNSPPGRASNTEVFDFDGTDDYLILGNQDIYEGEVGEPTAFFAWMAPDAKAITSLYINFNAIGDVGKRGIRVQPVATGPSLMKTQVIMDTTTVTASFDDIVVGNGWTMVGGQFRLSDNRVLAYSSRCATNTMVCGPGTEDTDGVQGVTGVDYSVAGDGTVFEIFGQVAEIFLWETDLTDGQICQICRSGYGNDPGNPNEPDDVIMDRWSFCATKVTALGCTLPDIPGTSTAATHVGPRRIF